MTHHRAPKGPLPAAPTLLGLRPGRLLGLPWLAGWALLGCAGLPQPERTLDPPQPQQLTEEVDLSALLTGMEGTFVVYEPGRRLWRVHDPERARRRFLPASTFKIPNSLIALQSGVADGPDFSLEWDPLANPPEPWWPRSWRRDQDLESAFQNSVYWFYQELARRVGEERLQGYLKRFAYGNQNMGGGLDKFWLHGDLRISPYEQVSFLERFYGGKLGISKRTTEMVKGIMVLEDGDSFRLSGKTGTANVTPTRELGWLVGFVERGSQVAFFALNIEGERVWEDWPPHRRQELVLRLLSELEVVEE